MPDPALRIRFLAAAALLTAPVGLTQPVCVLAQEAVTQSPAESLGFDPVAEGRLITWSDMVEYFEGLGVASSNVRVDTIGRSTLDRPMILVTISSQENLERLTELREIQAKLADPRQIASDEEREILVDQGRLIALITAGIHPTEVGGPLAMMRLAHRLATSPAPTETRIRDEAVVLVVPAINPDGIDPVKAWHEEIVDSPWAGADPPFLYHHYAGHDINRDWYALTQKETRTLVESVHQVWHPQLDIDVHQQEATGARFFIPPWRDPIEPNVDPLLAAAATSLGTRVQWTMLEEGRTGISVAARYDAWSPARAYVHYHAGVRMLTETASARLASPIEISPSDLVPVPGLDPRVSSWNHPIPWPGGNWALSDIVSYMESGIMGALGIAAAEREVWLRNFEQVGRRAVEGWPAWPEAWLVPAAEVDGADASGLAELIRVLRTAGVEVSRTAEVFEAEGSAFPAGSYLIDMHQPYAAFAQVLLAPQEYPSRAEFAGGPPEVPYDVTAHNLPLLLGVRAVPLFDMPAVPSEPVTENPPRPARVVEGLSNSPSVMIGLYRPWTASMDEGWTRWVFDNYSVPYVSLTNPQMGGPDLINEFTAIVLPSIDDSTIRTGRPESDVPPEYAGGLGEAEIENLRAFVTSGGTLVALGESVRFAISALELPVDDFLRGLPRTQFFGPGSQVGLDVDTTTFVGRGLPVSTAAWFENGSAFRALESGSMSVVARYSQGQVTRSGWVLGESWIAGRPAVVETKLGSGRVILFGFRPQYRGQALATYPLLFNALKRRPIEP